MSSVIGLDLYSYNIDENLLAQREYCLVLFCWFHYGTFFPVIYKPYSARRFLAYHLISLPICDFANSNVRWVFGIPLNVSCMCSISRSSGCRDYTRCNTVRVYLYASRRFGASEFTLQGPHLSAWLLEINQQCRFIFYFYLYRYSVIGRQLFCDHHFKGTPCTAHRPTSCMLRYPLGTAALVELITAPINPNSCIGRLTGQWWVILSARLWLKTLWTTDQKKLQKLSFDMPFIKVYVDDRKLTIQ